MGGVDTVKGLRNNDEAVKVLEDLIGTERNRIHQIYNLAYKKGYEDGIFQTLLQLNAIITSDKKLADGIPEYPCISCCDLTERIACCGCDKETQWQSKYGERRTDG